MAAPPPEQENKSVKSRLGAATTVNDLLRQEALKSGIVIGEGFVVTISSLFKIAGLTMMTFAESFKLFSQIGIDSIDRTLESNTQLHEARKKENLLGAIETDAVTKLNRIKESLINYIKAQKDFLTKCVLLLKERVCKKKRNWFGRTSFNCDDTIADKLEQELIFITESMETSLINLDALKFKIPSILGDNSSPNLNQRVVEVSNDELLGIIQQAQVISNEVFDVFAEFGKVVYKELKNARTKLTSEPSILHESTGVDSRPLLADIDEHDRRTSVSDVMVPDVPPSSDMVPYVPPSSDMVPYVPPSSDMVPDVPPSSDMVLSNSIEEPSIREIDGGRRMKKRSVRTGKPSRLGRRSRRRLRRTRTAPLRQFPSRF